MNGSNTSDRERSPLFIEAVPIGEIGDGSVRVRYDPEPAHNRSKFEIEWAWSDDEADVVYAGDQKHALAIIEALAEAVRIDVEGDRHV